MGPWSHIVVQTICGPYLDLQINAEDKAKIEKDHENPGINNDFKASVYQVNHSHERELDQNFLDILNTSDEEISELVSDVPEVGSPIKTKSGLKISLRSLGSSEEDERKKEEKSENDNTLKIRHLSNSSGNETDISDIIVSDMDY